jgi:dihydroxyacid dehydratase/phosphogluconate dehydratase
MADALAKWDITVTDEAAVKKLSQAGVDESFWLFAGPAYICESQDQAVADILGNKVKEGDQTRIDIPNRNIDVLLSDSELEQRRQRMNAKGKQGWVPTADHPQKVSSALKFYAKTVTSADKGAVRDISLLD